jgi:ubiquinone/menaquinone biosynthesis C-methylase UbiE
MDFELRQRGRASLDFLVDLALASRPLGARWNGELAATGIGADALPDDRDERHAAMDAALSESRAFAIAGLVGGFASVEHGRLARDAFEEIADELEPWLDALEASGPARLVTHPGFRPPPWWEGVWFHRSTGGWDGHPQMGFIHGELIHRHYVAKTFGGDIFAQRAAVLRELPRADYRRICEFGTSSGHYTEALQRIFPDAAITGLDFSVPMLRQALRVANANGWAWELHQASADAAPFPDASFDLVTSYIILHEMPAHAIRAMFREAFRLLEPGGHMLMSDVTPYARLDKLAQWRADWLARHGGEPWWREAASMDWAQAAREAGFTDVRSEGLDGKPYPHVLVATRPHG